MMPTPDVAEVVALSVAVEVDITAVAVATRGALIRPIP
jgi:hypothetical protein